VLVRGMHQALSASFFLPRIVLKGVLIIPRFVHAYIHIYNLYILDLS
jgi:hypothetical protein